MCVQDLHHQIDCRGAKRRKKKKRRRRKSRGWNVVPKECLVLLFTSGFEGKTKKSQSLCRFIFSFFFDRFFNWSANEFITKNDSRRNLNNVTQVEVRIYYYFFKNKFHNWKKKNVFVVWPTDVSTFRPLTVTPSAALRFASDTAGPPYPDVNQMSKSHHHHRRLFYSRWYDQAHFFFKKTKQKMELFVFNIWLISQQIDHSVLF